MNDQSAAARLSDRLRGRQLLHVGQLCREELEEVIALGEWFRDNPDDRRYAELLRGRLQVLLFVYESTRTRMGFEAAMAQLGGSTTFLSARETQMGRGETVRDTARALDQFVDLFVGRLWSQEDIEIVAENMSCPILNACTPVDHETHVMGELMCIKRAKGGLEGLNLVYTGMARGILHSFVRVCPVLGINLVLAIPESYARTVSRDILVESSGCQHNKDRAGGWVRRPAFADRQVCRGDGLLPETAGPALDDRVS